MLENCLNTIRRDTPTAKIVVITHNCPTYDILIDKYRENDPHNINSFFANDDLITKMGEGVKAWFCGHTHGCNKIQSGETQIATNTYGYEWETIEGFKPDAVLEII
jgi:hypothetical protein